jgi:hypothetical protein
VVEDGTKSVTDGIAQFTTFVKTARRFRSGMTANSTWKGELLEEFPQAFDVFGLVGIDFAVDTLEVGLRNDSRSTMAGTGDEESIEVELLDETVHMDIGEDLARVRTPMAEKSGLQVTDFERFLQQWIASKVQHAETEIKTGSHVIICEFELFIAQRGFLDSRTSFAVSRDAFNGDVHVSHGRHDESLMMV